GYPPRKHHDRWHKRKWPRAGPKTPGRRGGTRSECGLRAVRLDGENQAGATERIVRAARDAVPRDRGRNHPPRRYNQKNQLKRQGCGLRISEGASGGRFLSSFFAFWMGSSGGTTHSKPCCSSIVAITKRPFGAIRGKAARIKSVASVGTAL